jgi:hypothetical protein
MHGHWSVLGLNRGHSQFINFFGAPMILKAKSVFLAVNASLCWLNKVSDMYLIQVSLLFIAAGFGIYLQVLVLASHWLEDCANFTPTPEEND